MKKRLLSVLKPVVLMTAAVLAPSCQAGAQNLVPLQEEGRTIWVNADAPKAAPAKPAPASTTVATSRYSNMVYWNSKQHRWVPVPRASSPTMRAARQAAQEVAGYSTTTPSASNGDVANTPPPEATDKVIQAAATRHGVDPNLVRAIVRVESNFNPRAVSRKGAMGLMQLMPATAQSMNVSNAFDPMQNVDAGVRHLKSLLDNYNGNIPLSLAAYNAGSGAVKRNNGIPPFRETQDYVRKITNLYGGGLVPGRRFHVSRDEQGHIVISND